MADFETLDLSSIGLARDIKSHLLPPEAFSLADNMRFRESSIERIAGKKQIFGTPNFAPLHLVPVRGVSNELYWVYAGNEKIAMYYAGTHTDITRVSGDYSAGGAEDWSFTMLGGVPIFNNPNDVPQMWVPIGPGQPLQDLSNWNSAWRAKIIRSFGPYLVGFGITKTGLRYPHLVKWSHPADPGTVPISWDETDPTVDAGEKDLSDSESGEIVDARMLRGNMYIYKAQSTWLMRLIGGRYIFSFDTFMESTGILAPRCVAPTKDGKWHFLVTNDDIVIHDGSNIVSLLSGRMTKYLFDQIDTSAQQTSFVFSHPYFSEMWFCYPSVGSGVPNRALIWNYGVKSNIGVFTEADIDFVHANVGDVEDEDSLEWDDEDVLEWDSGGEDVWDSTRRRQVVVANSSATKIQQLDATDVVDNDGTPITGRVQRVALAVLGRRKDGTPIQDFKQDKLFTRIWIRADGGPFNVRVGYQDTVGGDVMWNDSEEFDPSTQLYIDPLVNGVAVALEFSAAVPFNVTGYKVELSLSGVFGSPVGGG